MDALHHPRGTTELRHNGVAVGLLPRKTSAVA